MTSHRTLESIRNEIKLRLNCGDPNLRYHVDKLEIEALNSPENIVLPHTEDEDFYKGIPGLGYQGNPAKWHALSIQRQGRNLILWRAQFTNCGACDGSGAVDIKGKSYECPACDGDGGDGYVELSTDMDGLIVKVHAGEDVLNAKN